MLLTCPTVPLFVRVGENLQVLSPYETQLLLVSVGAKVSRPFQVVYNAQAISNWQYAQPSENEFFCIVRNKETV